MESPDRPDFSRLQFDARGLVTVVAQDRATGVVRMLAHASLEALEATAATGFAHFHSRSRDALWKKGESSGNVLTVSAVVADCDADAVLYLVEPRGPTCHTGAAACFFDTVWPASSGVAPLPALPELEATLAERASSSAARSYTKQLLDGGPPAIAAKVREEADELATALTDEADERVIAESADVLYHLMVGLTARGLSLADVQRELLRRAGVSGLTEKASR